MNDPTVWQYVGFIVAAFILIWGVLELGRRLYRHNQPLTRARDTWVKLDATDPDVSEDVSLDIATDNQNEAPGQDIQIRAQQNGHHVPNKKAI